jgi:hypothetical protein
VFVNRFGTGWWVVLVAIIALALSQPLFLLLIWHFNIAPRQAMAANDLGALMGAIFTAGGLIVAIVSVYTMANLERVSREAVEPLFKEIPRQIDQKIRTFSESYGYYLRAQQAARAPGYSSETLQAIERFVTMAIDLEPKLNGIYAWTGRVYYIASALMYQRSLMPRLFDGGLRLPPSEQFPAVLGKALSWLKEAQRNVDGDQREVAAELAEVHGMMHSPLQEVLHYVEVANAGVGRTLPSGSASLAMLFRSATSKADVETLSRVLGINTTLTVDQIKQLLSEHIHIPNMTAPLQLLAIMKPGFPDLGNPVSPGMVRICWLGDGTTAFAEWLTRIQPGPNYRSDGIPPFDAPDDNGYCAPPTAIPIDELLAKVIERFFIVSRLDWDHFPERQ